MKNIVETEITMPQDKLAALLADPSNNKKWMVNLSEYKALSGTPGQLGSTYQLIFKNGMTFIAKTTKQDLPDQLGISMDSSMVQIEAIATLTALTPTKTKYVFEQDFHFKGLFNKIMGLLASHSIKGQQRKDVQGLKNFAEQAQQAS